MGKMTYIPDSLMADVEQLKEMQKRGLRYEIKCYDMICYDSKEERETEERLSPCTPFYKEEKEKEERGLSLSHARKECLTNPTLNEVAEYAKMFDNLTFTAEYFFHHYNALGWKVRGEAIENWQSLFNAWANDPKKSHQPSRARSQQRQQTLLAAETRLQEQAEQQTAERNERMREQADQHISREDYERLKAAGYKGERIFKGKDGRWHFEGEEDG